MPGVVYTFQDTQNLLALEKQLLVQAETFPAIIEEAATEHDPSKLAVYIYNLAKTFNSFYTEHSIINAESEEKKQLRAAIAQLIAQVIQTGMHLLGIAVPERM